MLKQITPPTGLPVSLAQAKNHLRIDHNEDDAAVQAFILAATSRLDGPEGYLGRCLLPQVWALTLDRFAGPIRLPLPPCQAVESVVYLDASGTAVTLNEAAYIAAGLGSTDGVTIHPATTWPATAVHPEAVTITFTAGFTALPDPLGASILSRVAHLYENRGSVVIGDSAYVLPLGEDDLTRNYRVWNF